MESASRQALATSYVPSPDLDATRHRLWLLRDGDRQRAVFSGRIDFVAICSVRQHKTSIKLALTALGAPILRLIGPLVELFAARYCVGGLALVFGTITVMTPSW